MRTSCTAALPRSISFMSLYSIAMSVHRFCVNRFIVPPGAEGTDDGRDEILGASPRRLADRTRASSPESLNPLKAAAGGSCSRRIPVRIAPLSRSRALAGGESSPPPSPSGATAADGGGTSNHILPSALSAAE